MWKVLASDGLDEGGAALLRGEEGIECEVVSGMSPEDLLKVIPNYHALIVRSPTKVTEKVFDAARQLKIVVRAGIGLDNIDIDAATKRGIVVANSPSGNVVTTAEHTLSLLMALARRIPQADISVKSEKWDREKFVGTELYQKVLGVIGFGKVGSVVSKLAQGLSMHVMAYDPFISKSVAVMQGVELVSLETLFKRADFITLHVPLSETTRYMIGKAQMAQMKRGVFIINCARGGLIDEKALCDAIVSGHIAGAALDVFEKEPPRGSPLLQLDSVVCTPHLGASTEEAQVRVAVDSAQQVIDFLKLGVVRNAVNMPSITGELLQMLRPYIQLAEQMGKFQAQICEKGAEEIALQYFGELTHYDTKLITAAFLKGFLSQIIDDRTVNFVNASRLAQERGLRIVEQVSNAPVDFASLIKTVVSANGKRGDLHEVSGTIFGKEDLRIVYVDGYRLEAHPFGQILFLKNYDRPKVIGNIGMILGEAGINISRMQLGLESGSKEALALINIDSPAPEEILGKLRTHSDIISVQQLKL